MKNLPNPTVPLVTAEGRPTHSLVDIMPSLSAADVVVDRQGAPTRLFTARLEAVTRGAAPNVSARLTNPDGTPTRVLTALLMGLR